MLYTQVRYGLPERHRLTVAVQEAGDKDFGESSSGAAERYMDVGYVIVRELIDPSLCDAVVTAFRQEVKPFNGPLLRQVSMRPSPHRFTQDGFVGNAFQSVQDLIRFPNFRLNAMDIIASPAAQRIVAEIMDAPPQLVDSVCWESTIMGTPLHADGDYIRSENGILVGSWYALEDIHPEAGRLVLLPYSHREQAWGVAAPAYREYRQTVTGATTNRRENLKRRLEEGANLHQALLDSELSLIAPQLNKGDAIFWDGRMIHGSLPPTARGLSRCSLAAHYIPDNRALVVHGRPIEFESQSHNGMKLRIDPEAKIDGE
jgi:phytanoyl-CoA hydroxylase